jgi:hypothetical protein
MDIAVNLVENYLRLTGYLTLSEFEVQRRDRDGQYRSITDVDIMAVRMPDEPAGQALQGEGAGMVLLTDDALHLEPGTVDVIIGEVKQGSAEFNPGIKDPDVLGSMLHRVAWLYDEPLGEVVPGLRAKAVHHSPGRGGGQVRTRLVAFGRSDRLDLNTISLSHIVSTLLEFFRVNEAAFRPVQFKEPAPAFLRLLLKAGFDIHHV